MKYTSIFAYKAFDAFHTNMRIDFLRDFIKLFFILGQWLDNGSVQNRSSVCSTLIDVFWSLTGSLIFGFLNYPISSFSLTHLIVN